MEALERTAVLRRQVLYPAELRARPLTLPNSALKRPVFEVGVPFAAQIVNAENAALHARPSAPKVRRGGLYPAELRARPLTLPKFHSGTPVFRARTIGFADSDHLMRADGGANPTVCRFAIVSRRRPILFRCSLLFAARKTGPRFRASARPWPHPA